MRTATTFTLLVGAFLCLCQPLLAQDAYERGLRLFNSVEIYFDFGSSEIRADAERSLLSVADQTTALEKFHIQIMGHTDSIGTEKNNFRLSTQRADAARDFMIDNGIPPGDISTSIYGETAPKVSNRTEEGRQLNRRAIVSIFEVVPLTTLEGRIKDEETGEGIQANVVISTPTSVDTIQTEPDGTFKTLVPENEEVNVDVYAEDYFYETQLLDRKKGKLPKVKVKLPPISIGGSIDIKNLYFEGDKAEVLASSAQELDKILRFMQFNPNIEIEIAGHINDPLLEAVEGSWDYELSTMRAKLVYDYLLLNGIESDRMRYRGYGGSQMRFPEPDSEEEEEANRRVEIRVLDTGEIISSD